MFLKYYLYLGINNNINNINNIKYDRLVNSPSDMLSFMDTHPQSKTSDIASYLDAFALFRDNVRNLSKDKSDHKYC